MELRNDKLTQCYYYYRPQRSWGKVISSQASVILSTGGGVHGGGMHGGGVHGGGMHGGGVHGRGVHGGGCAWQGVVCDMHASPGRYYCYGIRSMSGRYASYWNAFLLMEIVQHARAFINKNINLNQHKEFHWRHIFNVVELNKT